MKNGFVGVILILLLTSLIAAQMKDGQNYISATNNIDSGNINSKEFFCGTSTKGTCTVNEDCIVGGCSNSVCQGKNEEPITTTCMYSECQNAEKYNADCLCIDKECKWNKLNSEEIKNITKEKNKLRPKNKTLECPNNCTCTGSTIKCELENGREMTIYAGKSGNIIVQIKTENATTNVTLYKSEDGKIYLIKNNETKEVKLLPDQVREKVRERLQRQLEDENITLNENGTYEYEGKKQARLFFLFPIKVKVRTELDSETGNILRLRVPWWAFLAKDEKVELLVGSSCGTVTPGYNDQCCQNKGYNYWNNTTNTCEFSN
jgi:eight-cysteine-cluster-containing protein